MQPRARPLPQIFAERGKHSVSCMKETKCNKPKMEHALEYFSPSSPRFVDNSFVLQSMFTPPFLCNNIVSRIMPKNLHIFMCKDCAVVSWHAEVVQSPNRQGIFLQRSREKAQSSDPNSCLLELCYQAAGKMAVMSPV